ncbi:hypothetical protein [Streptomyces venezuelae]|uniref:hypothetical protein n=1 Tax=Streptomyces venezuelae TaxID=54571 RepID=UPI0016806AF6|nr:hypothetical protein [Streptomyces venezuelae]
MTRGLLCIALGLAAMAAVVLPGSDLTFARQLLGIAAFAGVQAAAGALLIR